MSDEEIVAALPQGMSGLVTVKNGMLVPRAPHEVRAQWLTAFARQDRDKLQRALRSSVLNAVRRQWRAPARVTMMGLVVAVIVGFFAEPGTTFQISAVAMAAWLGYWLFEITNLAPYRRLLDEVTPRLSKAQIAAAFWAFAGHTTTLPAEELATVLRTMPEQLDDATLQRIHASLTGTPT